MRVRFMVVDGPETGRSFSFDTADSFLVGRSPKAHLVLDPRADRYISRTHCLIDIRPPRCIVNDLGSTNGTYVNGQRIDRSEVGDGDVIRVGHTRIRIMIMQENTTAGLPEPEQEPEPTPACPPHLAETQKVRPPAGDGDAALWQPPQADGTWLPPHFEPERQVLDEASPMAGQAFPAAHAVGGPPPQRFCHHCGSDLVGLEPDELVVGLPDSLYLCNDCEVTLTKHDTSLVTIADYTVLGELGRGGMGIVLKAVHRPTRRICAIKELLPAVAHDERTYRLFEREIGIQAMVIHPNLARLIDHGREGETCYFVTEYLPGGDAGQLVCTLFRGPVEPSLSIRIMLDILAGLEALHERGFVHRDLKPANILLSRSQKEGFGTAKITDYGLAKSFEEAGNSLFDITRDGEAAGSLMFMPPEQILNYRFVRPPADVYAAGVSLYYLLTGQYTVRFPVHGLPAAEISSSKGRNPIEIMIEDSPIPIRERLPSLPEPVARVIDGAVQKELSKRYQTADELRNDLAAAARQEGLL